jgi:hypothetical protein
MRTRLLPFILGFATASVLAVAVAFTVVLPYVQSTRVTARNAGVVDAHYALLRKIPKMLGDDYRKSDGYETLFEVKTDAVVIVERNGVKTLRVYVDGP